MQLTKEQKEQFDQLALAAYPNECVALIIDGKLVPADNISPSPTQEFKIDGSLYASATLNNTLQAVLHTHTFDPTEKRSSDPRWASTKDMKSWIATAVPWAIAATNGIEVSELLWYDDNDIAPLLERTFIHGLHDCYSIIRDYYRTELGITLINHPRAMGWWDRGENLYMENFERAGFYVIPEKEADINDVCLFQVRSPVPNHAAVITGDNEITHHLFHRLSERDRLDRWRKHIVLYLRFDPASALLNSNKGSDDAETNNTSRSVS